MYDATYKIVIFGDAGCGKTTLTQRYLTNLFKGDTTMTIGVDFEVKSLEIDEKKVKLQIWDFGGEERFRFLLSQYSKGANGAFFLYDITNQTSLDHLPDWTQVIREHAGDIPIMLIGSKVDLNEFRAVTREEGILTARKYNLASFVELSSKTGENVEKAFDVMTEILFEKYSS